MPVCPHCKSAVSKFRTEKVKLIDANENPYSRDSEGVSYSCTSCSMMISVGPDIGAILKNLKKQ